METVADFIFRGSRITKDGDCSHEIKRHMLLGGKVDITLKSRDMTLPTKVRLVKAMVFPVVMYGCESWTVKKAECQRLDAFELWCWRRLSRVPWIARRSNQSILKKISHGISLEGMMLTPPWNSFTRGLEAGNSIKAAPRDRLSRFLCSWDFPCKNTGVGCHYFLQGIFPT